MKLSTYVARIKHVQYFCVPEPSLVSSRLLGCCAELGRRLVRTLTIMQVATVIRSHFSFPPLTHTCTHAQTHTRTHTHTHACTCTRTHTHTHRFQLQRLLPQDPRLRCARSTQSHPPVMSATSVIRKSTSWKECPPTVSSSTETASNVHTATAS